MAQVVKTPDYSTSTTPVTTANNITTSASLPCMLQHRYSSPQYNNYGGGYNNDTPNTSLSVTPHPHHHLGNNNSYQQQSSPQSWINMQTVTPATNNNATTSTHNTPVMLNYPLDESHSQPYLRMPPSYNNNNINDRNLKPTPPPPSGKNYYNTTNFGGPLFY